MPAALTLHDIPDDLYAALRANADSLGTSMNRAAKALLSKALGLVKTKRRNEFAEFFANGPYITDEEAEELHNAVRECRQIDWKEWK